jgi:molybdopterin adenylyltransferase
MRVMSVAAHKSRSPTSVPVFVLTVSDTRTPETDTSGQAIEALVREAGHIPAGRVVVKDEPADIARVARAALDRPDVSVIVVTGGTGVAPRDRTVEAIAPLFDRRLDGFGELFRLLSFEDIGPAAMLSRATAGLVGPKAVFLLPGSEAAVRLAMTRIILPELGHLAALLDPASPKP